MNFQAYIKTELLILIPVLYVLGIGLKKSRLRNKYIPAVLGIFAVVLSAVWVFAVTQGVLTAGASVYANQLYTQTKKEE